MVSIGSQFSTGDQGTTSRIAFWRSGFKTCQNSSCPSRQEQKAEGGRGGGAIDTSILKKNSSVIKSEDHVAGCRMNGDGYGTTVFTCTVCGWQTSFQYDDASEDCYYYETRYWDRSTKPPPPPHPWAGMKVSWWLQSMNVDPAIITKCRNFNLLSGPALYEMTPRKLRALTFTKEEAATVMSVIQKKKEVDEKKNEKGNRNNSM